MKVSTKTIMTAVALCLTLNVLQATIIVTNKTDKVITVSPYFKGKLFGETTLQKGEYTDIPMKRGAQKITQISITEESKDANGKPSRKRLNEIISPDSSLHNSDTHHIEYTGEIKIID